MRATVMLVAQAGPSARVFAMPDQNSTAVELRRLQLDVIAEEDAVCRDLGRPAWLRGGWAMDFGLGRVTRWHALS